MPSSYGTILPEEQVVGSPPHSANLDSPASEREHLISFAEPPAQAVQSPASGSGFARVIHGMKGYFKAGSKRSHTTEYLSQRHGINVRRMYLEYNIPALKWMRNYGLADVQGDLLGAITIASIYIPMALSLAATLSYIPAIHGLYTFVVALLCYALLGTSPVLIVGPEVACSLMAGQAVLQHSVIGDDRRNAEIVGIVTLTGGIMVLLAGIFRLGFLDNLLSRPFLRGFISSIGLVVFIEQAVSLLGLSAIENPNRHGSSALDKLIFVIRNISHAHPLTCAVSLGALTLLIVFRSMKSRLVSRYPSVSFFPDRFLIVVAATVATWCFSWQNYGLDIMGDVTLPGRLFPIHVPVDKDDIQILQDLLGTSFVIALLGFFESSVAGKSLVLSSEEKEADTATEVATDANETSVTPSVAAEDTKTQDGIVFSANRELVALGIANVIAGFFMCLPAFGGYGRSKVGIQAGGHTPMESIFLAIITLLCAVFLTPFFFYIPRGVLSAMIADVGLSLLKEAPPDIRFFVRIQGWSELFLMGIIFAATVFWDLKLGMMVGMALSILQVVRHSTRPRFQLLGRNQETNAFEHADAMGIVDDDDSEVDILNAEFASLNSVSTSSRLIRFVDGCLIVKIPEPLIFANASGLEAILRRFDYYGTRYAHPGLPRVRAKHRTRNLIFDLHGMTGIDGASAQILRDVVDSYQRRGVRVFFSRVQRSQPMANRVSTTTTGTTSHHDVSAASALAARRDRVWHTFVDSGIVQMVGGESGMVDSVDTALDRIREFERVGGGVRDTLGPAAVYLPGSSSSAAMQSSFLEAPATRRTWSGDTETVVPRNRVSD